MPTAKEIQDQVKDTVKKSQDTVVTTVKGWTDTVNNVNLPFAEQIPNYVPQAKSAVNSAFDIAEQVVSRQRELVNNVLDAVDSRLSSAKTKTAKASSTKNDTPKSDTKSESQSA